MNPFFAELSRRHVFRAAGVYAVVGWLLMQLSNHFEEALNLPGWFDTFVTLLVLMGFPVAMVLAWAFDLTPRGIERAHASPGQTEAAVNRHGKLAYLSVAALTVLMGVIAWQLANPGAPDERPANGPGVDEKSIAVMPFIALSVNESDGYFGKGIAEELLNALTNFPELKVAARTSAFSFEGSDIDLREVGQKLGVAHVLEGSVRSAGDKVRVTAQLIRAQDGFHLWSETYDRDLSDLFAVQDAIVAAISRTLQIHLGVGMGANRADGKQVDPRAYQQYLRGLELWGTRSQTMNRVESIRTFRLVTETDPGFADGWAAYGEALTYSAPEMSGMEYRQHFRTARNALERAMELDPDNARTLAALAANLLMYEFDIKRATELAARAAAIAPNLSLAHYANAWVLELRGEMQAARRAYERAIALDPLNNVLRRVYALHYHAVLGDYDGVIAAENSCEGCSADDLFVYRLAEYMAARRGGSDEQVRAAARVFREFVEAWLSDPATRMSMGADVSFFLDLCSPAFVEWLLGGPRPPESELTWMDDPGCAACETDYAPMFARVGEYDTAIEILHRAYERGGSALFYIIDPIGRDAWPDAVRRHPRFHAFWQLQGMPELAVILRANGITGGLPLPMGQGEGSDTL